MNKNKKISLSKNRNLMICRNLDAKKLRLCTTTFNLWGESS